MSGVCVLSVTKRYMYNNISHDCCQFFPMLNHCVFTIQVVLRASAGMDYWEFAQFLSVIGLPRLREAQAILSFITKPSDAITSVLSSTELLLLKITTLSRKLTFFESGALPDEFRLNSTVSDNFTTCDCLTRQTKEREKNVQPFAALYDLLPEECHSVLALDIKALKGKEELSQTRQRTHTQLIFRLFELVTISTVLGEVLQCVSTVIVQ